MRFSIFSFPHPLRSSSTVGEVCPKSRWEHSPKPSLETHLRTTALPNEILFKIPESTNKMRSPWQMPVHSSVATLVVFPHGLVTPPLPQQPLSQIVFHCVSIQCIGFPPPLRRITQYTSIPHGEALVVSWELPHGIRHKLFLFVGHGQ